MSTPVGYIGLGTMGGPMAANVAKAGFDLTVFDVRDEPCAALESLGATVGRSAAAVAERSRVILLNVVDDAQVRDVLLGSGGLLDAAQPGAVIGVHSTIHPATCREMADEARRRDLGLVDAPFSGGLAAAHNGTLTFMVGGTEADLEACRAVLDSMSATIVRVGDVGMGLVAKITNNAVLAAVIQATSEGLDLSRRAGIDDDLMLEVLGASAGASWVSRNWRAIEQTTRAYPGGARGMANLVHKDLTIALAVGHDVRASLPLTALTSQLLDATYAQHDGGPAE